MHGVIQGVRFESVVLDGVKGLREQRFQRALLLQRGLRRERVRPPTQAPHPRNPLFCAAAPSAAAAPPAMQAPLQQQPWDLQLQPPRCRPP